MDKITQAGYQQVVDNIAYHLSFMLYDDENGIFALGKFHPTYGKDIEQIDKIANAASKIYGVDPEHLMDEVMEKTDLYLSELILTHALT